MKLTIEDVARLAGVSKTTVSLVLNDKAERGRISRSTRTRVLQIVQQHGFSPSRLARAFRSRRSGTIGLVVPDLVNPFFARLCYALEQAARGKGLQVLVACSDDLESQEAAVVRRLLAHHVEGLAVASVITDATRLARLYARGVPTVLLDREIARHNLSSVTSDNYAGAFSATVELLSRDIREIAYLGGDRRLSTTRRRWDGFRAAHTERSAPIDRRLVVHRNYSPHSGEEMMRLVHTRLGRLPQAVFTGAYTLLEGVLAYLKRRCGSVPAGLQLVTFDDHPLLDYLPNHVISIEQDTNGLADATLELLGRSDGSVDHRVVPTRVLRGA